MIKDSVKEIIIAVDELIRNGIDIPDNIIGTLMSVSVKLTILNYDSKRGFDGVKKLPN